MKKILLSGLFSAFVALGVQGQISVISTNIANNTPVVLKTSRASIASIEITSDKSVLVDLFNQNTVASPEYGTNYVNAAYQYRTTYSTNYVTSYVGNTGFTNWYTNAGIWTLTLTNAANTNALSPGFTAVVGANSYAVYPVDLLFEKGIVARASTNVSLVITYRAGN